MLTDAPPLWHRHCNRIHPVDAKIQVDPVLPSCLPSTGHWPAGSCSVPGAGLHQVSISSFLQPLLSWTLNCWLFEPDGSPMWNCTGPPVAASTTPMANHPPSLPGKGRRLQAQASLGIAWKTWCSNLKGDSEEHFSNWRKKSHSIKCRVPIQFNITVLTVKSKSCQHLDFPYKY